QKTVNIKSKFAKFKVILIEDTDSSELIKDLEEMSDPNSESFHASEHNELYIETANRELIPSQNSSEKTSVYSNILQYLIWMTLQNIIQIDSQKQEKSLTSSLKSNCTSKLHHHETLKHTC